MVAKLARWLSIAFCAVSSHGIAGPAGAIAAAPPARLTARDLAVIVNDSDPLSVAVGEYYRLRRNIPAQNIVHVRIGASETTLTVAQFDVLRAEVESRAPSTTQAYVLTWVRPYRVACMSITTAFAAGFDPAFCSDRCTATRWSPYYNSNSRRPFDDLHWRPTMSLAALDFAQARALIDRGVAADSTKEYGKAYLVSTPDAKRNVRAQLYPDAALMVQQAVPVEIVDAAWIESRRDVMFYFTGLAEVPKIGTNRFLPGAVADHLTSYGGDLTGTMQMSSLRWLEAGATGSYGTVTEPCNLPGKFPSVGMMMRRYVAGETLIEAYWKSVAMPGQGIFIGEPLAAPFARRVK